MELLELPLQRFYHREKPSQRSDFSASRSMSNGRNTAFKKLAMKSGVSSCGLKAPQSAAPTSTDYRAAQKLQQHLDSRPMLPFGWAAALPCRHTNRTITLIKHHHAQISEQQETGGNFYVASWWRAMSNERHSCPHNPKKISFRFTE